MRPCDTVLRHGLVTVSRHGLATPSCDAPCDTSRDTSRDTSCDTSRVCARACDRVSRSLVPASVCGSRCGVLVAHAHGRYPRYASFVPWGRTFEPLECGANSSLCTLAASCPCAPLLVPLTLPVSLVSRAPVVCRVCEAVARSPRRAVHGRRRTRGPRLACSSIVRIACVRTRGVASRSSRPRGTDCFPPSTDPAGAGRSRGRHALAPPRRRCCVSRVAVCCVC